MNIKILIIDELTSQLVTGTYGTTSELLPIKLADGRMFLPVEVLNDDAFISVREVLKSCPIEEVDESVFEKGEQ